MAIACRYYFLVLMLFYDFLFHGSLKILRGNELFNLLKLWFLVLVVIFEFELEFRKIQIRIFNKEEQDAA